MTDSDSGGGAGASAAELLCRVGCFGCGRGAWLQGTLTSVL